jgi:peroxiredoxin
LKAVIVRMQEELRAGQEVVPALQAGEVLGPLQLPSLTGAVEAVGYDDTDQETVLLVFSPDCPACQGNMDAWKRLVGEDRARAGRRFFYVSTADEATTRRFADTHELTEPVLVADRESMIGYKITYIPTTIVVAPGGVVRKVWIGGLPDEATADFDRWAGGS